MAGGGGLDHQHLVGKIKGSRDRVGSRLGRIEPQPPAAFRMLDQNMVAKLRLASGQAPPRYWGLTTGNQVSWREGGSAARANRRDRSESLRPRLPIKIGERVRGAEVEPGGRQDS